MALIRPEIDESLWVDTEPVKEATNLIRLVHRLYKPRQTWCLCSGGNDSLCATHVAMQTGLVTGVASINTTIGIQETRDHLKAVSESFGWNLQWFTPPASYIELCARFGMPGPGGHNLVYQRLKERCVRQLVRLAKKSRGDTVMLITGCRTQESDRRMGTSDPIQREGRRLWVAPIINWSAAQQVVYQTENRIPRNPVKPYLGISGECLCGAFAKPGEREKIQQYYPHAYAEIVECERVAAENKKPCAWGKRPVKEQPLCQNCTRKND